MKQTLKWKADQPVIRQTHWMELEKLLQKKMVRLLKIILQQSFTQFR